MNDRPASPHPDEPASTMMLDVERQVEDLAEEYLDAYVDVFRSIPD